MAIVNFFFQIILILYFFTAFVFFIGKSYFPVLILFVPIGLLFLILILKKKYINTLLFLYKKTPFKYLVFLYIWIIFSGFICSIFGYYSFFRYILAAIIGLTLRVLFVYIYPAVVISHFFKIKTVIKIFTGIITFILLWGLIEFIGALLNIDIINQMVHFFSNIRDIGGTVIIDARSRIPRIRSLFMEPGVYALFLTINLPIIFNLCTSKYKIFKNKNLNIVLKKILIPLALISIVLTQSPIYFVFASLVLFFMFYKKIFIYFVKNYHIFILTLLCLTIFAIIILFFTNINLEKTFIQRIIKVIQTFSHFSLESLIASESSLATRVVNNIVQFNIFMQHPIFGIGFGNNGYILINAFRNASIPLTGEMIAVLQEATSSIAITTNAFYLLLHQTGIIGFILYVIFMIKSIFISKKITKFFGGIERYFIKSLSQSILIIFVLSIIYNQGFISEILLLYTGTVCALIYKVYHKYKYIIKNQ